MRNRITDLPFTILAAATLAATGCARDDRPAAAVARTADTEAPALEPAAVFDKAAFRVPVETEVKDTVTLASIRRGRALIRNTRDSLPQHVRAKLSCANCHMADGTEKYAMPLVGSYARFPQYRARSGKIDLIENRVNDCFERSMNGRALDRNGQDMRDIVAYLAFLSRGFPVGIDMDGQGVPALDPLKGDTAGGRAVYAMTCVACHGADGGGTIVAPPLWGPDSYNIGAGMSRVNTAARFIHKLMPRNAPGSLAPQQAFDVAAFVNSRPRPDFAGKENDWPKGGAPPDVAYKVRSAGRK